MLLFRLPRYRLFFTILVIFYTFEKKIIISSPDRFSLLLHLLENLVRYSIVIKIISKSSSVENCDKIISRSSSAQYCDKIISKYIPVQYCDNIISKSIPVQYCYKIISKSIPVQYCDNIISRSSSAQYNCDKIISKFSFAPTGGNVVKLSYFPTYQFLPMPLHVVVTVKFPFSVCTSALCIYRQPLNICRLLSAVVSVPSMSGFMRIELYPSLERTLSVFPHKNNSVLSSKLSAAIIRGYLIILA